MDASTFDYIKQRAEILSTTDASKQETKDAANAWLAAVEADSSEAAVDAATDALLSYLDGRPQSIDSAIEFGKTDAAVQLFGSEEMVAQYLAYQEERKAAGEKYCPCDACAAASEILMMCGCA